MSWFRDFPLTHEVLHHEVGEVLSGVAAKRRGRDVKVLPKTRERAKRMRREMTRAETILWTRLRRRQVLGFHFRRQAPIGAYIADFACAEARLVVEVDGATHSAPEELAHDERRRVFIEGEGWTILRVWNDEVFANETGVVETVMRYLMNALPPPSPGSAG